MVSSYAVSADDNLSLVAQVYVLQSRSMYNARKDWFGAVMVAALGAGIITSFAVSQGQDPFVGLGITAFASVAAVIIDHFC